MKEENKYRFINNAVEINRVIIRNGDLPLIIVPKKPTEKPREKSVYRERRLILQILKDFIKNLDVM